MLVCPRCKESKAIRPAHRAGSFDGLCELFRVRAYRCDSCLERFRRFGEQDLDAQAQESLPAFLADPTAFKTLRFEGNQRPVHAEIPGGKLRSNWPALPSEGSLPDRTTLANPLAMSAVEFEPGEIPERLVEHEHFDPLFLMQELELDAAPVRAEGNHIFDPLAFENKVYDRAVEVSMQESRLRVLLAGSAEKRAARNAFLNTEEGAAVRAAQKRQTRWVLWSLGGLALLSPPIAICLYSLYGEAGYAPKRLYLSIAAVNLFAGTIVALVYPRQIPDLPGVSRPRFVELMLGWVGSMMLLHFIVVVVLVPALSGHLLNLSFYPDTWPWLFISYAALAVAAAIGWLVDRARSQASRPGA